MDLVHQLDARIRAPASGSPVVVMVQSSHDRNGNHFAPDILRGRNQSVPFRDLLLDALMRSCLVEVAHIRIEDALELPLMKDQQLIQAFLSGTPQEALADGIGSWGVIGRFEYLDATCRRHPSEAGPKFVIVITYQVLRCVSIWGGFSQLLRHPGIRRGARHAHVDHLARLQFDEEERKKRSKEEIGDLDEVTRPDVRRVIAEKRAPLLPS